MPKFKLAGEVFPMAYAPTGAMGVSKINTASPLIRPVFGGPFVAGLADFIFEVTYIQFSHLFLSSGRCTRSDTAMTGEITLRGLVLPVSLITVNPKKSTSTPKAIARANTSRCLANSGTKTAGSVTSCRSNVAINWHLFPRLYYSKAPKSATTFNLFAFFRADLIQSEVNWNLSLASDWMVVARKNVN